MKATGAVATYTVDLRPAKPQRHEPAHRLPRVVRLLALGHAIERRVTSGEFQDLAAAARAFGLTRARVTQLVNLTLLAPAIQEDILAMPPVVAGRDPVSERALRRIVAEPDWTKQRRTCHPSIPHL